MFNGVDQRNDHDAVQDAMMKIKRFLLLFCCLFLPAGLFSQTHTGGGSSGGTGGNPSSANMIDPTQAPYSVNPTGGYIGNDGSVTNTQNLLSSASTNCSAGDTGKSVVVVNPAALPNGVYLIPTVSNTTITGCSGNSWTMSQNATGTLAGTAYWAMGWDAAAGLASAYAASFATGVQAGKVLAVPCGVMMLSAPPFNGPTYAAYAQHPDIQGCNTTGGSVFVFLPTIANSLSSGGALFSSVGGGSTGSIILQGSGTMSKIENITLTSLGGGVPLTSHNYSLIQGYYVANNIFIQMFNYSGSPLTVNLVGSGTTGESAYTRFDFQNSRYSGSAVQYAGQGINGLKDSVIAFNANGNFPVLCNGYCTLTNDYFVGNNSAVGPSATNTVITLVSSEVQCNSGSGLGACLNDNSIATTWYIFGNPLIQMNAASTGAINCSNTATQFDISGSLIETTTAHYPITGNCSINDRAGVGYKTNAGAATDLGQFAGIYNPIGGGSMATYISSAATNFGTALGAQTVIPVVVKQSPITMQISARQSLAGASCSAGTNTATITLNYTAPGATAETISPTVLSISANGAVDSGATAYQTFTFPAQTGSAVTYTVASALASTGCSPVPQYTVDARVF